MKKILMISLLFMNLVFVQSCTSDNDFNKGKSQLEQQGYTNVENTGHAWFCCDEKDTYSTGFKCKDKSGNTVSDCFCSTVLKGVTIRFR